MDICDSVIDISPEKSIIQFLECLCKAYNIKDIKSIEQILKETPIYTTEKVSASSSTMQPQTKLVECTQTDRQQYIKKVRNIFKRSKYINAKYEWIDECGNRRCGTGITRSNINSQMYGVRTYFEITSDNYAITGFLFMIWEFSDKHQSPIIHVVTWQPENVGGVKRKPDDNISTLNGFYL